MESPQAKPQHISDHLANERTILAWIRTSISVIALGVAINRFSLFLMEFYRIEPQARASNRHAEAVGVGLGLGSLLVIEEFSVGSLELVVIFVALADGLREFIDRVASLGAWRGLVVLGGG